MSIKSYTKKILRKIGLQPISKRDVETKFTGASNLLEMEYGHLLSKEVQMAVNSEGKPLPWFTYSCIEYLNQLDLSDKIMLEWGAGNSSLYFSPKVKKLVSIESNEEWYSIVKENKMNNQSLILAQENYDTAPFMENIKFDIILIDGILRKECSESALKLINKDGLIILDNSDRYPYLAELFRQNNYLEVDFHGLGPINDYAWTTSLFFSREINLKPVTIQPVIPIGGGF